MTTILGRASWTQSKAKFAGSAASESTNHSRSGFNNNTAANNPAGSQKLT
jgi:hypothetical protein